MFVNIVKFPKIREGKDRAFREWFTWSNERYSKHQGFIRRRLLQPSEGGEYSAIVEHESRDTFMAMHTSPTQAEAHERVEPLFDGGPSPEFFETVIDSARKE
ncbi:MAG: antibiotic biosynthesis monooxygenase [Deltaproteobacteria bacterium]|nr:antibiotic biosynthesis monooxygenase [Deltaproteobacteria bacterium]